MQKTEEENLIDRLDLNKGVYFLGKRFSKEELIEEYRKILQFYGGWALQHSGKVYQMLNGHKNLLVRENIPSGETVIKKFVVDYYLKEKAKFLFVLLDELSNTFEEIQKISKEKPTEVRGKLIAKSCDLKGEILVVIKMARKLGLEIRNQCGYTPLTYAVYHNLHNKVVIFLINKAKVDVYEKSGNNQNIHFFCLENPNVKLLAQLYKKNKFKVSDLDKDNLSPLQVIARYCSIQRANKKKVIELVEYILSIMPKDDEFFKMSRRYNPEAAAHYKFPYDTQSPIYYLSLAKRHDLIDFFYSELGICLEYDSCDRTALYTAAEEKHFEVLRTLLRLGADPNYCRKKSKFTPLHIATTKGNVEIVTELLHCSKTDANKLSTNDNTALHCAISDRLYNPSEKDMLEIALKLIPKTDINIKNADGFTAKTLALLEGNNEIFNALLKKENPKFKPSKDIKYTEQFKERMIANVIKKPKESLEELSVSENNYINRLPLEIVQRITLYFDSLLNKTKTSSKKNLRNLIKIANMPELFSSCADHFINEVQQKISTKNGSDSKIDVSSTSDKEVGFGDGKVHCLKSEQYPPKRYQQATSNTNSAITVTSNYSLSVSNNNLNDLTPSYNPTFFTTSNHDAIHLKNDVSKLPSERMKQDQKSDMVNQINTL